MPTQNSMTHIGPSAKASFIARALSSPPECDMMPYHQTKKVLGCPGLLRWDMINPMQGISSLGESMDELVERSGLETGQ